MAQTHALPPYWQPAELVSGSASASNSTTAVTMVASQGVGYRFYLTTLIVTNTSGTDSSLRLLDGNTERAMISAAASSGAVIQFSAPMRFAENTSVRMAASTAVVLMYGTAIGYRAP